MKRVVTASEMKAFDRNAIERLGVSGLVLMENAGRGCVDAIVGRRMLPPEGSAVIVCGKGNNGGDGFVVARHLLLRGYAVETLLVFRPEELSPDALTNYRILQETQGKRGRIVDASHGKLPNNTTADVIVDALVGTGFDGKPSDRLADAIDWINGQGKLVVAIDIPSGVDSTVGSTDGEAVRATQTVTMGWLKQGLLLGSGRECAGLVDLVDIGVPAEPLPEWVNAVSVMEGDDVRALLPVRAWNVNKYSAGKVFVIAGSRTFTGAPCLAARAALKSGAGAVVLGIPTSAAAIAAQKLDEVIVQALPETNEGTLGLAAMDAILDRAKWADAVVLGPGLGRNAETDALVRDLVQRITVPLCLDADGLNALAGATELLKRRSAPVVLTPHTGELSRLINVSAADIDVSRVDVARRASVELAATVVVKGAPTVVGRSDGAVNINATGNPGLATVGTGDVLAGLIGSLLGQGMKSDDAAACGVWLHGLAGDLAVRHGSPHTMIAGDLLDEFPEAFAMSERCEA